MDDGGADDTAGDDDFQSMTAYQSVIDLKTRFYISDLQSFIKIM
jgi:hypothetical protein